MIKNPGSLLVITILMMLFTGCRTGSQDTSVITPSFNPLITAFTTGMVSAESSISIRFSEPIADSGMILNNVKEAILSISPDVVGNSYYLDKQTIVFRPEKRFRQGTAYDVRINLARLFPEKDGQKYFEFRFHTAEQHLSIDLEGFRPYNDFKPGMNLLNGSLRTVDVADAALVRQVITARQHGRTLPLTWDHDPDGKTHLFTIDSILRTEEESLVQISYNGTPISADQQGTREFSVPALGDFKVISHQLVQYPDQHVIIRFSDPIRKNQDLKGLIRLSNDTGLRFSIDGNIIKAYPNVRQNGLLKLLIESGIRNTAGKGLPLGSALDLLFEDIKPAIELLGEGEIIPAVNEVILPFKAVNLKAVELKVIRIYEDNIAQFLQVNSLGGGNEVKRAGRLIMKKTISLVADKPVDYAQWNTFSLNLTDLVKTQPGAIYRIELNFSQQHSLFPCDDRSEQDNDQIPDKSETTIDEEEISYWDSYDSYYSSWDYYDYDGYTWEDRDDPCKPAYYGNRRAVARNVLASNLGIIAKQGTGDELHVTITDLLTAHSVSNATVTAYNFQQQQLDQGTTDNHGMVALKTPAKPFLVVAEHEGQKGYLRLVDGSALSFSMFDVSGASVQKGIKGFLFGERGVWRPGDSLFLNLIIDDRKNPLPDGHPVKFELKNPRGKVIQQHVAMGNESRFYTFHTKTEPDAPTGKYILTATLGGVQFTKGLLVETIKPNRLKINLTFPGDTLYPEKGNLQAELFGQWLTGAMASNLKAKIEVSLRNATTTFEGYKDYTFSDPSRKISTHPRTFWEGQTDQNGYATIDKKLQIGQDPPGMLNAVFTTRLFERSGNFSIDQGSVICSPYQTYVGIKTPPGDRRDVLVTDTAHTIEVVTLSSTGDLLTRLGLDVEVYKLSWRWWWDASYENLASYMGSNYIVPFMKTTISTRNGKGSFDFRIDYPEWGRYLVKVTDQDGHSAAKTVYVDWPGWAGRARKGDPDAASVLTFSSDKSSYKVGERAMITIPSSPEGRILISLENGTGVIRQEWIESGSTETRYYVDITPEMTPGIYAYASLIQPHGNVKNDLPIRMFGVIPLRVEDPQTRLYPQLDMPESLSPNAEVKLKVSERNNHEMIYTIAMVDEGLLDLTRFRTPDPWSSFYAREALGVKTWDMFEQVLGAYGGRVDGIYNVGGDMQQQTEPAKEANRFPPMVRFLGPFKLHGKSNIHTIQIPNYIGSVRTMIIAANRGAYGHAEKTTQVKQPLMLLATLPRVLGPGEEVTMPVSVFVMDEEIRQVELLIETNDLLVADTKKKRVSFNGTGDQIVDFQIKTREFTGVGKVRILADAGSHHAEYEIEIPLRTPNPPVSKFITHALEPGETCSEKIRYLGMTGTNELLMEVSGIPPVDFGRRLKYLVTYPHGCVEQVTSAVFPQLFMADVMELDDKLVKKTHENVKAAISKLAAYQLSDGGFSYWPGSNNVSSWGTSYAGHFLHEATEKGYDVPEAMIRNWTRYQRKAARRWSPSGSSNAYEIKQEQLMQAYRLFTLALMGEEEMGSMNRMREQINLAPEAKWRLAAAYALSGQQEPAKELISGVTISDDEYHDSGLTFGSRTRDQAMILETMLMMGMREQGLPLMEKIAGALSGRQWLSTQTTAFSLVAIAKFVGDRPFDDRIAFEYQFNDGVVQQAETGMPLARIVFETGKESNGSVNVTNQSGSTLFVRIVNTGLPAPGEETAVKSNLGLTVRYTDMEGHNLSPASLKRGTDFKAVYTVYNPGTMGPLPNVALTTRFPPGWEIYNERLLGTGESHQSFSYQDVRDDRVMTYFSIPPNQSKSFTIRLNAAYKGRYYLPAVKVGEMYMQDVQAVIPGRWIEVHAVQ